MKKDGSDACSHLDRERKVLQTWLKEGARGCLIFEHGGSGGRPVSFYRLLYEGRWSWVLKNRLRSIAAYIAELCPLPSWKSFWYWQAGVKLGKNSFIAHGVKLDLMFPQLLTIEENSVVGMDAMIQAHHFDLAKACLGRVIVKAGSVIGARSLIAGPAMIGPRAVVAIAAVLVNQNVEEAAVVGGIPARLIKTAAYSQGL
ncbi:MAG: hypothetical protein LBJ14_05915 [Desulfarculales bacterium]|jgi:acetyltransferase-like isoleucine patch superfamily enzyme|nr:hypothetical protein [Desulfarculales bacterium]